MKSRVDAFESTPALLRAATGLQQAIDAVGLDKQLGELVKMRASQINGCAFCLHMHTRDARKLGESETRIYLLSTWRESPLFDAKERAVLAWTEALTEVSQKGAPDALYADLKVHFTDPQIIALTSAIAMINFWNRLAIGFQFVHPLG